MNFDILARKECLDTKSYEYVTKPWTVYACYIGTVEV